MIGPILALAAIGTTAWYYLRRKTGAHEIYAPPPAKAPPVVKALVNQTIAKNKVRGLPKAQIVTPTDRGAPPLDSNGLLGHTGIPGSMFWGLPMKIIWNVEDAYAARKTSRIHAVAQAVRVHKFNKLADRMDADVRRWGLD